MRTTGSSDFDKVSSNNTWTLALLLQAKSKTISLGGAFNVAISKLCGISSYLTLQSFEIFSRSPHQSSIPVKHHIMVTLRRFQVTARSNRKIVLKTYLGVIQPDSLIINWVSKLCSQLCTCLHNCSVTEAVGL